MPIWPVLAGALAIVVAWLLQAWLILRKPPQLPVLPPRRDPGKPRLPSFRRRLRRLG